MLLDQESAISETYFRTNKAMNIVYDTFKVTHSKAPLPRLIVELKKEVSSITAKDVTLDLARLNRATKHEMECGEVVEYLKAEFDALKLFSHSAIVNYGKVLNEKNKFERQCIFMKKHYEDIIHENTQAMQKLKVTGVHILGYGLDKVLCWRFAEFISGFYIYSFL